jgi:hypothetical protein
MGGILIMTTAKKQIVITDYDQDILDYIKANANTRELFICTIPHVSQSGMSRDIRFGIIYKGQFVNVTYLVCKLMKSKMSKHDAYRVGGCGMDMIFHSLETFMSRLGIDKAWNKNAVQSYKLF